MKELVLDELNEQTTKQVWTMCTEQLIAIRTNVRSRLMANMLSLQLLTVMGQCCRSTKSSKAER